MILVLNLQAGCVGFVSRSMEQFMEGFAFVQMLPGPLYNIAGYIGAVYMGLKVQEATTLIEEGQRELKHLMLTCDCRLRVSCCRARWPPGLASTSPACCSCSHCCRSGTG